MQRITTAGRWPLFDVAATRRIEQAAALALPEHALMRRAGLAAARLALAIHPHARTVWVACGPGNNGGDGFEAAIHLQRCGKAVHASWSGDEGKAPADARLSLARARAAGVAIHGAPPAQWDIAVDALLGIGTSRAPEAPLDEWISRMNCGAAPVLSIDVPSGLNADRGTGAAVRATQTLSLLTLKPGLFTAEGRDACGDVWFDDLGMFGIDTHGEGASAFLGVKNGSRVRPHASHKGSYGDVAVIGGGPGMTGAALLAGSAALHAGAGRVFVALLQPDPLRASAARPELMLRAWESLDLARMAVACGCGGGEAVRSVLPKVLSTARSLVIDADALNAIAVDGQLQSQLRARAGRDERCTVITPHPLEAARLLACSTAAVQSDRLGTAAELSARFACVTVLKGSGTVTAAPLQVPVINLSGNARLATAGTGDVLAGMIAARLAQGVSAFDAASHAVHYHGQAADRWPSERPLTAGRLAASAPADSSKEPE